MKGKFGAKMVLPKVIHWRSATPETSGAKSHPKGGESEDSNMGKTTPAMNHLQLDVHALGYISPI